MTKDEAFEYVDHLMYSSPHESTEQVVAKKYYSELLIEYIKNTPEWIPVWEKLPEENGWYLVTAPNIDGEMEVWMSHFYETWFDAEESVAWMPLPKPYEVTE